MSVTIYIGPGPPCQVDGFRDGAERSVKGALYLRSNALATITHDELEYVQRVHPEINCRLRVVRVDESVPASEDGLPEAVPPSTVEDTTESVFESESEPEKPPREPEDNPRGRSRSRKKRTDSD